MVPPWVWQDLIRRALIEDVGAGDLTTNAIFSPDSTGALLFCARQPLVSCGMAAVRETYQQLDDRVVVSVVHNDGTMVAPGDVLARISGPSRALLTGERVALNIVQRLSAIATVTRQVVRDLDGLPTLLLDTRKTTPGWRTLERWATSVGGAKNHRFNLHDAVLIKDNHIAGAGGIQAAIHAVKESVGPTVHIEIEVDRLDQIEEALAAGPAGILFDNMDVDTLRTAVFMVGGRAFTEASGGIRPDMVRAIAETGVNALSLGWLTHSAQAVDIGADWEVDDGQ